jgi:thiol-disulfide isomerase/thioredoxin
MRWRIHGLLCLLTLTVPGMAWGQQSQPSSNAPPAKAPAKKSPAAQPAPKSKTDTDAQEPPTEVPDPEAELQLAVTSSGNDNAALVRNLEEYLVRYPDSPQRLTIYRGIMQSEVQLHNRKLALEYAQRIMAIQPEDTQTLYVAATILEQMPDDASQMRAIDYDTRLIANVAKADPESRPDQMTLDDWQAGRNKFMMNLYILRGRMERHLHRNDDAVKDFTQGFHLLPSAEAAMGLGEIAEEEKRADEAIRQYALAFFLPGLDPKDTTLNREYLRLRMGNLWRFTHDSSAGLGDVLLSAFDKSRASAKMDQPPPAAYNQGVTDPLQFTLRKVDGNGTVKTADTRGKVVILNFWTTWCAYCRITESLLAGVRDKFAGRNDVVSLSVNADEEEGVVAPFLKEQKVDGTLVFADGLDQAFHVTSIPTIIVLDRSGKIAYRAQGFAPDDLADAASAAIAKASAAPAP